MLLKSSLAVFSTIAIACFAYPMYVIQPFRAQGEGELARALLFRQWGPQVSIVASLGAIFCAALLWRRSERWLTKSLVLLIAGLGVAFAGLAQFNVFERMFHRIDEAEFAAAADAAVDADDMVLAVGLRAYPVRTLAYHHIVNDRLVVTTY